MAYKLTASDRVMILQALWCKERELIEAIKLKKELGSDADIIEKYEQDLRQVQVLDNEFLNWSM